MGTVILLFYFGGTGLDTELFFGFSYYLAIKLTRFFRAYLFHWFPWGFMIYNCYAKRPSHQCSFWSLLSFLNFVSTACQISSEIPNLEGTRLLRASRWQSKPPTDIIKLNNEPQPVSLGVSPQNPPSCSIWAESSHWLRTVGSSQLGTRTAGSEVQSNPNISRLINDAFRETS